MIAPIKDPFEPRQQPSTGTLRDSSNELAQGVVVNEFEDGDTIPAELLPFLEAKEAPKP